jgi:hypothetical protein
MTDDEVRDMPETSALLTEEEFAAWIVSREEAGAKIDIGTAELKGWLTRKGDPYERWAPKGACRSSNDSPELCVHFFVRCPESRGWVWQGDLPEDKGSAMQARIDEHNRKVKDIYANRRAAGRLIDVETCEGVHGTIDESDPYGIELAPYGLINYVLFVRNKDSDDWIWIDDLPAEKIRALRERSERERLAREHVVDNLFDALRQGGVGLAAAVSAIAKAEKTYGERIVEDALGDYSYPYGAIGGLMIERGYLTMAHVSELLRGDPKGPPDIFGA